MNFGVYNFDEEFSKITDYWSPRILGEVNDQYIKIAKLKGELVWHSHDNEDEFFYLLKGRLDIQYRDQTVTLEKGDFHIVPKGVEHNPVAEVECWVVLIETKTTQHTGNVETDMSKPIEEQLKG